MWRHGNCWVVPVEAVVEPLLLRAPKVAMAVPVELGVLVAAEVVLALMELVAEVEMVEREAGG